VINKNIQSLETMSITLKVPTIACEVCAETITKAIKNNDPSANVKVDVPSKMVVIETETSDKKIKQAITDAGHEIA